MLVVQTPPSPPLTLEEYLEKEYKAETRSEFFNNQIVPMAGASKVHSEIASNVHGNLFFPLRKKGCSIAFCDRQVLVEKEGKPAILYPDLVVVCGKMQNLPNAFNTLTNPTTVVEILSESTLRYDLVEKRLLYYSIPSLNEYIVIDQHQPLVEIYTRLDENNWANRVSVHLTDEITIGGCPITLAQIYDLVEFSPPAAA